MSDSVTDNDTANQCMPELCDCAEHEGCRTIPAGDPLLWMPDDIDPLGEMWPICWRCAYKMQDARFRLLLADDATDAASLEAVRAVRRAVAAAAAAANAATTAPATALTVRGLLVLQRWDIDHARSLDRRVVVRTIDYLV